MLQVLLYDGEQMHTFELVGYFPEQPRFEEVDITTIEDMTSKKEIVPNWTYRAEITTGEVKAELDPTTMKRIAKYNLDKDFEELNRKIKSAESRLENLNEQAEEKEQKLELMRELFPKIWNDANFDQDKYLSDEDCDYGEGD